MQRVVLTVVAFLSECQHDVCHMIVCFLALEGTWIPESVRLGTSSETRHACLIVDTNAFAVCRLCVEDCTTALAQLEAVMEAPGGQGSAAAAAANRTTVKLLTRRAAANAALQDFQKAEADFREVQLFFACVRVEALTDLQSA